MARPPNPETIAGLNKRLEKLEGLVLELLERERPNVTGAVASMHAVLVGELNLALGLTPGTLEGRVETALRR